MRTRSLIVALAGAAILLATSCRKSENSEASAAAAPVQKFEDFHPTEHTSLRAEQIDRYVAMRKRARQMNDERVTRGVSLGDTDADATKELGENPAEMKWIREQLDSISQPAVVYKGTTFENWQTANRKRDALRSVGIVVPDRQPMPVRAQQ